MAHGGIANNHTEDQLRTLLQSCPVFDEAARARQDAEIDRQWEAGNEPNVADFEDIIGPSVGFDAPGYNGILPSPGIEVDPADAARLEALLEIVYQAEREYQEAREDRLREMMDGS